MTKKILFLSKGESASSTRYRALQYFPLYKQAGFEPTHITISGGLLPFLTALYHATQADVVVLLRKTFPTPFFWLLRKVSKKLVFELDDAIFSNTDGAYSKTRMSRFIATVSRCNHVFAGNQYLANIASQYQPHTSIIPTSLDTKKYCLQTKSTSNSFVLVWIGSHSTKKYIAGILPSIEAAAKQIPNLTLTIIADFQLHSDLLTINNIPWSEDTEAEAISNADVGLAPLPVDNWTKGKCALKVLQYLAAGLPVISSNTSANAYVVEHFKSGFLTQNESESEWTRCIITAFKAKDQLQAMGDYGKNRVQREFDKEVVFQQIIQQLTRL